MTFDEAIDPASTPSHFLLKDPNGVLVESTIEVTSATLTLKPAADLDFVTKYSLLLLKGIKDLSGNETPAGASWEFTTGNEPDQILPAVADRSPGEGEKSVPVRKVIKVTFSEAMNESSVTAKDHLTVSLIRDGKAERVKGTVRYEAGEQPAATFTSSERLEYDSTYQVFLDLLITDAAGNPLGDAEGKPLASPLSWSFRTAPLNEPPPEVTSTDPVHGSRVSVHLEKVAASFRQPIDTSSLTGRFTVTASDGTAVQGSIVPDSGPQAIFALRSALLYNTWYRATLGEGILSASGAASTAQSYSWCFRTELDPDIVEPEAALPPQCAQPGP